MLFVQVEEVPLTFSSTTHYMNSFTYLLLEETRADMFSQIASISQAPTSPFIDLQRLATDSPKKLFYRITLTGMKYDPMVGDLIALTQVKPKSVDDLAQWNSSFVLAYVTNVINEIPMTVYIMSSHDLIESSLFWVQERPKGFVVYLTNLTTNMRIWQALNPAANMDIIQRTLSSTCSVSSLAKQII